MCGFFFRPVKYNNGFSNAGLFLNYCNKSPFVMLYLSHGLLILLADIFINIFALIFAYETGLKFSLFG